MLKDKLSELAEVDLHMKKLMLDSDVQIFVEELKAMLRQAAEVPGRAAKLRCTYLVERMIELAQDLEDGAIQDQNGHLFAAKFSDIMVWLDRAVIYAAKLVNPETAGKYVESFDQIKKEIEIYNPKDPALIKEREKMAQGVQSRFADHVSDVRRRVEKPGTEPSRSGGNIIVPGGLK